MINVITYNFDTSTHMFSFSGNLFFDDFLNKIKKKSHVMAQHTQ